MNFWEKISNQKDIFERSAMALDALPNCPPRVANLIPALAEARVLLNTMQADMRRVDRKEIARVGKQLKAALGSYASSIKKVRPDKAEANIMAEVFSAATEFLTYSVKSMREAVDSLNADAGGILATNMDEIKEKGRMRTTFSNGELDVGTASVGTGVGQLLWVGENVALAQRTEQYGQELINSRPHQDYENLISELENAEPAKQMEYAKLLANRERQLTAKLTRTYKTLLSRYEMQQNGNRNVMEALVNDESYRDIRSYYALKDRLMQGNMAKTLAAATSRFVTPRVSGHLNIPALMNNAEDALQNREDSATVQNNIKQKELEALKTSGLPLNPFAQTLFGLATQIAADPDREASPYYGIAHKLSELQREDHTNPTSEIYEKRLRACAFEAEAYLKSHRKVPYTEKGKRRVAAAREVLKVMQERLGEISRMREPAPEANAPQEQPNEAGAQERARLARYQSNVGTAKLDPPVPTVRSEVGLRKDADIREVTHDFYTFFKGVEQVTTALPTNLLGGGGMWLYHKIKGKSDAEKNAQPFDSDRVPGMRGEKFREPVGDGIITDKRRIPLVWERPIPEDPNQPITLTFEVDQPFEGNDVGSNWNADKVGHAFLTLRYTKVNPATGKEERYRTSFGFYPKQSASGFFSNYAMASVGTTRMGEIMSDFDHPVSVGSTVTITPQQFNDIVRFTGDYEKGGYNMVTRNCTDFALDAVRHAGVSIPELDRVEKVDLTNTGPAVGIANGLFDLGLGSWFLKQMAQSHVRSKLESREVNQYSRLGQAEASLEDLERVKHAELNTRLRGYAPGETAEAIRGSYGFALHSKKYLGTEKTRTAAFRALENAKNKAYSGIKLSSEEKTMETLNGGDKHRFLLNLMEQEIPRLRSKIEGVYGTKNAELNGVLDKMEQYQSDAVKVIREHALVGLNPTYYNQKESRANAITQMFEGVKQLNDFISQMNTIFHDEFRSDSRVNIPFQNMVSLAEQVRDRFEEHYLSAKNMPTLRKDGDLTLLSDPDPDKYIDHGKLHELETALYDQSRDTADAMWNANHVEIRVPVKKDVKDKKATSFKMLPSEFLATMLAFDDPEAALRRFVFSAADEKTSDMVNARTTMVKALETYQDGHEYTDAELDAVFNRMPALEKKLGVTGGSPSAAYQTMALSAILGNGFLGDLNGEFNAKVAAQRDQLRMDPEFTSQEILNATEGYDDAQKFFSEQEELFKDSMSPDELNAMKAENGARLEAMGKALQELKAKHNAKEMEIGLAAKAFPVDFMQHAQERLEERLNHLPADKKAKLDHLTAIMANSLIEERKANTNAAKSSCVAEAKERLGSILVKSYVNSLCRKAIKQMTLDSELVDTVENVALEFADIVEKSEIPSAFRRPERQRAASVHQPAPKQTEVNANHQRSNSFSGMGRK